MNTDSRDRDPNYRSILLMDTDIKYEVKVIGKIKCLRCDSSKDLFSIHIPSTSGTGYICNECAEAIRVHYDGHKNTISPTSDKRKDGIVSGEYYKDLHSNGEI